MTGKFLLDILKEYWPALIIIILLLIGYIWINVLEKKIENRESEIEQLIRENELYREEVEHANEMIEFQSRSLAVLEKTSEMEQVSEKVYQKEIINNKKIVEKYKESDKTKKDKKKLYDHMNRKWKKLQRKDEYDKTTEEYKRLYKRTNPLYIH